MIRVFKDSYKLSLLLAIVFFVGILFSAYVLYSLPRELRLTDGFQPIFFKTYVILAASFLSGATALYVALHGQREVLVYRDRTHETDDSKTQTTDDTKTTITLDGVKTGLQQAQGEKEILKTSIQVVCKQLAAGQGAIYLVTEREENKKVELKSGYALGISENATVSFDLGEGLVGQCALTGHTLYIDEIPEGYIKIISGLGSASPNYLLLVPITKDKAVTGVMEIASFTPISEDQRKFVEESAQLLADRI